MKMEGLGQERPENCLEGTFLEVVACSGRGDERADLSFFLKMEYEGI